MSTDNSELFGQDLMYDLRAVYAVGIVGKNLMAVNDARTFKQYVLWFESLKNLYTVIDFKFKNDEQRKQYENLVVKANEIFNKHRMVYFGKSFDPIGVNEVTEALRDIEKLLYRVMQSANMFGANRKIQGL